MNSILAKKMEQGQKFLENGKRIPVTKLSVSGNVVAAIKTLSRDKYSAVQLGFEKRKKEVRMTDADTLPVVGDVVKASAVFQPGDIINVTGISKGKGYAGGVKRYHFKGGPRTHGQSDRERAPGAIGTTTTPGRVYKGKRMAGKMGHEKITVKNIEIVEVNDDFVLVKGLVPGGRNTLLMLKKVGAKKKFVPLYAEKPVEEARKEEALSTKATEGQTEKAETAPASNATDVKVEEKPEVKTEVKEEVK